MEDSTAPLSRGDCVELQKRKLQEVIDELRRQGYRTVGSRVGDGAIVFDDLISVDQLPVGVIDEQDGGHYRLRTDPDSGYFDYVVGPHSLKNFLFPSSETIQELTLDSSGWHSKSVEHDGPPLAVIGLRGCDLHALEVQDRTFLGGPYVDPGYQSRREKLFIVAVNCRRCAATCFCHSMKTGPAVDRGFDLALTELDDTFIVEVGSDRGRAIIQHVDTSPCSHEQLERARALPRELEQRMHEWSQQPMLSEQPRQRHLDTTNIRDLLLGNLEHSRWDNVAARCLACTNCTMVCPTCFCSTVEDVADLAGENVHRERSWASCFSNEHSHLSSGPVRPTIKSQYRQWLTHKLASWIDQFGTSGCTGCGRCITWCPVGIDLTEEVAAIRAGEPE